MLYCAAIVKAVLGPFQAVTRQSREDSSGTDKDTQKRHLRCGLFICVLRHVCPLQVYEYGRNKKCHCRAFWSVSGHINRELHTVAA